eukprot:COSAG02_NODE_16308_length_1094_cov_0.979899_2_plen_68_part_01
MLSKLDLHQLPAAEAVANARILSHSLVALPMAHEAATMPGGWAPPEQLRIGAELPLAHPVTHPGVDYF